MAVNIVMHYLVGLYNFSFDGKIPPTIFKVFELSKIVFKEVGLGYLLLNNHCTFVLIKVQWGCFCVNLIY